MRLAPVLVAAAGALAACGSDPAPAAGCGPVEEHAVDPSSAVHVIPGATVDYATDPPTSGPHAAVGSLLVTDPVHDEPLPGPVQVGLLEQGAVVVQYDPDAPSTVVAGALARAETGAVVVAPAADPSDPLVATAWGASLRCRDTGGPALDDFVAVRVGGGPGHDGS